MTKQHLRDLIVQQLENDHHLLLQAATSAHSAATHTENIPDSKYETLALEASYIAQGQANRAQEIKRAIANYRNLEPSIWAEKSKVHLGALVLLEDEYGRQRRIFIGPDAGGMKLRLGEEEVMIVTPGAPLGKELLGRQAGDSLEFGPVDKLQEYEILDVC